MDELLKLLKEAVGIRVLLPIVLILLAGYLFKFARDYPAKELLYDRWYLLVVLLIVAASAAFWIFQSGLAERTVEGRYGIYIARFKGDASRVVHTGFIEALVANLSAKAGSSSLRFQVRDLNQQIEDKDIQEVPTIASRLNASTIVWGTVVDNDRIYLRQWSKRSGIARSPTPISMTDISKLAEFASDIWSSIEKESDENAISQWDAKRQQEEILALQREVKKLGELMSEILISSA